MKAEVLPIQVRYADFVAAAREVFAYKLNNEDLGTAREAYKLNNEDLGTERTLKSLSDSMDDISKSRAELNKSINTLTGNSFKPMIIIFRSWIYSN